MEDRFCLACVPVHVGTAASVLRVSPPVRKVLPADTETAGRDGRLLQAVRNAAKLVFKVFGKAWFQAV